jgi:short subunit dehydrogenase-like uncharacterized protein
VNRAASRNSRRFDVVLWGATGFTGRLVAEYLARRHGVGKKLAWALGGRSREKLEKVRAELEAVDPGARELPLMLGDSADRPSLDAIARDTRVVASTVGPYAIHGRDLVAACVDAGTDCCDLTGEPQFIRAMIDTHHARAGTTGARIVHCCGYDSIPSDLGTLMLQTHMREKHGGRCAQVRCYAGAATMAVSGGTIASMLRLVEDASHDRGVRKILIDPYSLDPDRGERGPDRRDAMGVRWDADLEVWTGPFAMAAINGRIVRRTNALLGYSYGRDFRYLEGMSFRSGAGGWLAAAAASAGTVGVMAAAAVPPVRWLARNVLPSPGEGPSKETRESGSFVTRLVGLGEAADGAPPARVFGTVRGDQDPGYGATAKMLGEAAVCLALDGESISRAGGILTPGSCMGMRLIERLRAAGMTFEAEIDEAR